MSWFNIEYKGYTGLYRVNESIGIYQGHVEGDIHANFVALKLTDIKDRFIKAVEDIEKLKLDLNNVLELYPSEAYPNLNYEYILDECGHEYKEIRLITNILNPYTSPKI